MLKNALLSLSLIITMAVAMVAPMGAMAEDNSSGSATAEAKAELTNTSGATAAAEASAKTSKEASKETEKSKATKPAKKANPQVVIKTSEGDMTLVLYADKAPLTVANFLSYVDSGFYNDTIFHRVIPNFMIQGGGFTADMKEKDTQDPVANESKNRKHNTRGTIAMARTSDPDSATSQFYINQRSNLQLDWAPGRPGYTVFGEVVQGMNVVDFIATAPTGRKGRMGDVPKKSILIKKIVRQTSK